MMLWPDIATCHENKLCICFVLVCIGLFGLGLGCHRTVEFSADACQQRCQVVEDCAHFTFWPDGGCLLTGDISYPKASSAVKLRFSDCTVLLAAL